MTPNRPDSFDDPSLKQALRDAAGGHKASDRLRSVIAAKLAAERPAGDGATTRAGTSLLIRRFAAAAAVIVVLAGGIYGVQRYRAHAAEQAEIARVAAAKDTLLTAMLSAHARTCGNPQPLIARLSDPSALAAEAAKQLGRPVPQPILNDGWTLDDAAICDINGERSARFRFTKGTQAVTLVSMPKRVWDGLTGSMDYALKQNGHSIAGYEHEGSLNCIVADASLTSYEVQSLRDKIREQSQ